MPLAGLQVLGPSREVARVGVAGRAALSGSQPQYRRPWFH